MVVIGTFEWSSLRILRKIPRRMFVIILVSGITVITHNLALAVTGVIVSVWALPGSQPCISTRNPR